MFDAKRDNNQVTTLIGVSSVDGITPVTVYVDPVTHRILVQGATGVTSVATDSTLTGGPITTTGTLGLNLGNANTWTATQTFSNNSSIQVLANGAPGGGTIGKGPGNELEISSWNQSSFSNISIRAQSGSPGYQLYLGTNGNIGVGTATPGSALQVNGGVAIGYSTSQAAPTNGLIVLGHLILEGVTSTGATGTGNLVFGTSPTLVTPALGVATATSINGLIITSTTGTLTLANGKTFTVNNTLTLAGTDGKTLTVTNSVAFAGTDGSTVTFGAGGTIAYTSNNLSVFASTTSAQLAGVLSDETGTGAVVFGTNPTIAKPIMNARNQTASTYSPAAAATATLDLSASDQHDITMPAGNITIALSNDTNNQLFTVSILQDGTGGRTVTWFTTIRWAGGAAPTLTTTASKRDTFLFKRTGSGTYDGFVVGMNI